MLRLAVLTAMSGINVSGCDVNPNESVIRICRKNGIALFFSHDAENLCGSDTLVYSAAIPKAAPELIKASELGIRIFSRAEYLSLIAECFESSVAISGTHGKSTVSFMTERILSELREEPTLLAGAVQGDNDAEQYGSDRVAVIEACEYAGSFLALRPSVSTILNIEREHTDIYPTVTDSERAFLDFGRQSDIIVYNADCLSASRVGARLASEGKDTVTFSVKDSGTDVCADNIKSKNGRYTFDLTVRGLGRVSEISLNIIGRHSVINAAASAATAYAYLKRRDPQCLKNPELLLSSVKKGLEGFNGIKRRLEYIGSRNGADIFDDYAHHPTEIRASLSAIGELGYDRIVCAFQPHTFSRTHDLFDELAESFSGCDEVIIADIYAAREVNTYSVTGKALADAIPNGKYIGGEQEILRYLTSLSHPKTVICTMGAGRLCEIAQKLVFGEDDK